MLDSSTCPAIHPASMASARCWLAKTPEAPSGMAIVGPTVVAAAFTLGGRNYRARRHVDRDPAGPAPDVVLGAGRHERRCRLLGPRRALARAAPGPGPLGLHRRRPGHDP